MTTIAPGLKKYVEREAPADAPPARPGSKVHVHFTATVRSSDVVVDSSRGEFTTEVGGVTVRKCNVPLALTLPGVETVGAAGAKTRQSLTRRRQALPRERRRNPRTKTKTKTPRRFPRRGGSTSAGS